MVGFNGYYSAFQIDELHRHLKSAVRLKPNYKQRLVLNLLLWI